MSFYIYSHSRNYDCATKAISISIQSSEENTSYWYMTTMIQYIQGLIFSVRKFTEDSD